MPIVDEINIVYRYRKNIELWWLILGINVFGVGKLKMSEVGVGGKVALQLWFIYVSMSYFHSRQVFVLVKL